MNIGGAELTAPLPQPLPEGATDVTWVPDENALNYFVDEVPFTMAITEADLAAALAYEPPPSPPVVPDTITRRQFHMVAFQMFGLTEGMLNLQINGIEDEHQRTIALIDYHQASAFRWDWPLLVEFATALGITEEQRKAAWIAGAKIL